MRALGLIVIVPLTLVMLAVLARATQNQRELDLREHRSPRLGSGLPEPSRQSL